MIQSENSSKKIKENKYKILRMSLLLGQDENREETINNFEDSAREIDVMNNETYLSELENKLYETDNLNDETAKLTNLVDYIKGRISQRESLLSDYANVTGRNLIGLGEIKYEDKLEEYEERLKYINEYLDNTNRLNESEEELRNLKERLIQEEELKQNNEEKNKEIETLLLEKFESIAKDIIDDYNLTEENIDIHIAEMNKKTEESKNSLDIFKKSFETLKNAGINSEDEQEYKSYVIGARDEYYEYKEKSYLMELYRLLLTNEQEFTKIYIKRNNINELLNERIALREELEITEPDNLTSIYNILAEQKEIVEGEQENIDNISTIAARIEYIEDNIKKLKEDNNKIEILSILKEYNIIDTYMEDNQNDFNVEIPNIKTAIKDNTDNIDIPEPQPEEITEEQEYNLSTPQFSFPKELNIPNNNIDINVDIPTEEEHEIKEEIVPEEETEPTNEEQNNNIEEKIEQPVTTEEVVEEPKKEEPIMEGTTKEEQNEDKTKEPELPIKKPYKNNFVMGCHDPLGLNADECVEKATNVMKKVGEMLNIIPKEDSKKEIKEEKVEEKVEEKKEETNPFFDNNEPKEEAPTVNPFFEENTEKKVEIDNPATTNSFLDTPKEEPKKEESNVKNVLSNDLDFWSQNPITETDSNDDIDVSNDDFFANSMNDFEFPNLDEFK